MVGVVALLVFGPSGLADIAKQLGATIREFQPTIKELQDVSKEFQDTLRDEIEKPLEEATAPSKRQAPVGEPVAKKTNENVKFDLTAVSGEASGDAGADTDTVTDEMKAASAAAAWGAADAAATDAMDVADVADELVFLDSSHLSDLRKLLDHVEESANYILMLTRSTLARPGRAQRSARARRRLPDPTSEGRSAGRGRATRRGLPGAGQATLAAIGGARWL